MRPVVQPRQEGDVSELIQPMPPLSDEQLASLRADIEEHGVLVPIAVDRTGRIIDGNNRAAIAAELGIDCPQVEVDVPDDDAALDMALTMNCARRHLTQEQRRDLIRAEIARRPADTDRAIARRIGCSPTTVGTIRKANAADVSNLDSQTDMTAAEAEARVGAIRAGLTDARGALYALVGRALVNHISVAEVVGALTMARLSYLRRATDQDREAKVMFAEQVYDYVAEVAMWAETLEQYPPHPDSDPTTEEREWLIQSIASMGNEEHPADFAEAE